MYILELKKKKIIALITELLNLASKKYESYLRICEFLSPQSQYSALLCEKHLKSIFTLKEKYNQIPIFIYNNENEKEIHDIEKALLTCCKNRIKYKDLSDQLKLILYKEKKYYILAQRLENAVDSYANIWQRIKTFLVGSSLEKALDLVLTNDEIISKTAEKYSIEKEFIQAIIFQEQRFLGFDDPIADALVLQSNVYDKNLEKFVNGNYFYAPLPILGYRNDSSTGLGQIFAKTAINAINAYEGIQKYSVNSKEDIKAIWNALQNTEFNIDTIGSIMLYNKNILLDENNFSNRNLLKLYNGSGNLAEKYSLVTEQYFNAFKEYNSE